MSRERSSCKSPQQYLVCNDDGNSEFIGEALQHPQTQAKMLLTSRELPSPLNDFSRHLIRKRRSRQSGEKE